MSLMLIPFLLAPYLLGSIPSAVWVGKSFYGIDVREHGSNNAGATNTFRVLGVKAGILVLVMDIVKGATAANLAYFLPQDALEYWDVMNFKIILGILAVIGHIFPVFAGFKGGKGIATLLGMVLAVHWPTALTCLALFVIILLLTRYVSLSSIISTVSFPFFAVYLHGKDDNPLLIGFGLAMAIVVVFTHRKNIRKLLTGQENKANLFKKQRAKT